MIPNKDATQKVIVCDIDDTISITTNRDWVNAKPIQSVIDKLNSLYDQGWDINLVTARGNLSCTTRADADAKYRVQITEWLKKYGVKYTSLSFEKQLAAYYVDDKSIRPDEFVALDIRTLKNGMSGAIVELRDGRVFKTDKNSILAAKWYGIAKSFFNVPIVRSLIGNTISYDYIDNVNDNLKIDSVIDIINKFKSIPAPNNASCDTYIQRLINHNELANNIFDDTIKFLSNDAYNVQHYLNVNVSFCHGDLTIDNMLNTHTGVFLIDPIYEDELWSSWLLDASKYAYSLLINEMHVEYEYFKKNIQIKSNVGIKVFDILISTHCIRVYKYADDITKTKIITLYNKLLKQYRNYEA